MEVSLPVAPRPVAATKSAKRPKLSDELPDAILRMSQRDIEAGMICEKITLTVDYEDSNFVKGKEYSRAVGLETQRNDDGTAHHIDLAGLQARQLQKLANKMGMKNSSRMKKEIILLSLGTAAAIGSVITSDNIIDITTTTTTDSKRHNTIVRLTNVIFSDEFLDGFLQWNDQRTRADFERGVGGTMQRWLAQVHKAMYDTGTTTSPTRMKGGSNLGDSPRCTSPTGELDDEEATVEEATVKIDMWGKIDDFPVHPDHETIKLYIDHGGADPSDYIIESAIVLREWILKLIKARNVVLANMKKSGEHSPDHYKFVDVALKQTKTTKTIGSFALYYFCMRADCCTDFDKRFLPFMSAELKGDSTMTFDSMSAITNATTPRGKKSKGGADESLDDLAKSMITMEEAQTKLARKQARLAKVDRHLSHQHKRNAKLQEIKELQSMLKIRSSPILAIVRSKMEERVNLLYEQLFPTTPAAAKSVNAEDNESSDSDSSNSV